MAKHICKNYGSCTKADSREAIELVPGSEPLCDECGFKLEPVDAKSEPGTVNRKLIVSGLATIVVIAAAIGAYLLMPPHNKTKAVAINTSTVPVTSTAGGVAPDGKTLVSQKRDADAKILEAGGAGAPATQKTVIAKEYIKAAIPLMQAGKWQEAEAQLLKAKTENPDEPLIYVNTAIVRLKQTRDKEALTDLETAFKKGFKDFATLEGDADLKPLTTKPDYGAMAATYKGK